VGLGTTIHPSTWRRTPADVADWFDEAEVRRSREYTAPVNRLRVGMAIVSTAVIVVVVLTHLVPNVLRHLGIHSWELGILVAIAVLDPIQLATTAPASFWMELVHDKRWDLSNQTVGRWVGDRVKELLIGIVFESVLFVAVYWTIRYTSWWWLLAAAFVTVFALAVAFIYPVVVMPMFNKFVPVADDSLRQGIERIAEQAGVTIRGAFTMDGSKRSRRDNAFVAGYGATKRVVVYDTMLEYPQAGIEQVVAHELGHYRLNHVLKQVPLIIATSVATFASVDALLHWHWLLARAGVHSIGDPGSLPLFAAVFGAIFSVMGLVSAWVSRAFEREADLEALVLLRDPDALIEMFRNLQTKNLGDLSPSWTKRIKASHPEIAERMAFAKAWADRNDVGHGRHPSVAG
jgi:STE24 endopeptidase